MLNDVNSDADSSTDKCSDSHSEVVDIAYKLKAQGVFPTQQRMIIANVLFSKNQHLTADQVDDLVRESKHQVSKATIYNTLGLFVKKNLLNEIHIDSSRTFYDTNTQPHQHFYNIDSGKLTDINLNQLPEIIQEQLPEDTQVDTVDIIVRIRNH